MIKVFTIKLPYHTVGRSYRLDFPISGNERYVTGAFAVANVFLEEQPRQTDSQSSAHIQIPNVLGKVSISSDGKVVSPSIPLLSRILKHYTSYYDYNEERPSLMSTARKLMRAVDFGRLGNKLSIIVEEFPEPNPEWNSDDLNLTYTVKVYLKTIKSIC